MMLMTEFLCWWLFSSYWLLFQCKESVTNIMLLLFINWSLTSEFAIHISMKPFEQITIYESWSWNQLRLSYLVIDRTKSDRNLWQVQTGKLLSTSRKGQKTCKKLENNQFQCDFKERKAKVLLVIPSVQSEAAPSLQITETGELWVL